MRVGSDSRRDYRSFRLLLKETVKCFYSPLDSQSLRTYNDNQRCNRRALRNCTFSVVTSGTPAHSRVRQHRDGPPSCSRRPLGKHISLEDRTFRIPQTDVYSDCHGYCPDGHCSADSDRLHYGRRRTTGSGHTSQMLSLGASSWQLLRILIREARLSVLAAVMAGFGRVVAEVGASMMVGAIF